MTAWFFRAHMTGRSLSRKYLVKTTPGAPDGSRKNEKILLIDGPQTAKSQD
ncbi:hypothetical protein [Rhodobium orientis]|nr:hypothetical protein [Rhodobium orientis]